MRLILNEKILLDKALNEGYIVEKKPTVTMSILIRHYFSEENKKKQVIELVDKFFSKNYKGYNTVKWRDTIEKIIKTIQKDKDYSLREINSINITESELEVIKEINNNRLEKLAFVLLVYAKIYNQINKNESNWVNEEHKYIFSDAKIAVKIKDQGKMIHTLSDMGLVESSKKVDCTNLKVKFVDDNSDVVLSISDFRNFVYEYLRWKGYKINTCENEKCKILFSPTNNRQVYCKSCWKEKQLEWQRESMKKIRSKNICEVLETP